MNIFVLNQNPFDAARDHCDKHVVKMILEYAQMLSTAHRLLDGTPVTAVDPLNRVKPKKFWLFLGEEPRVVQVQDDEVTRYKWEVANSKCYQVAHANHPCSVWARETDANYWWLQNLLAGTAREYTARYGKTHSAARIFEFLNRSPHNIKRSQMTPFALAMPEEYKHDDPVEAYRRFYVGAKARFAKWKNTPVPGWFKHSMERQDATNFA